MEGTARDEDIEALLLALRAKGETAEEVAGAAEALRAVMVRLETSLDRLIDTAGTGGGTVGTFNISSAAAFVAAGAGARVAKHGNRSHTSRCGSAEVFGALGIATDLPPARAAQVLNVLRLQSRLVCHRSSSDRAEGDDNSKEPPLSEAI